MIETIKDLERLLKLLRKQGVTKITLPECSLQLGEQPAKQQGDSIEDQQEQVFPAFDEPLTNEEMTRYANGEELN